jgi:rhamnosyltransferase
MLEQPVSIILRSFNEAWALAGTLQALKLQSYRNWELIVFDSGSSDGSVELIRQANPAHFIQMLPHEYQPGRVLNQGMKLAKSDRVIFLNADATPQGLDWLKPLVEALSDPKVAAVFSRQIPRIGCKPVFARDYERCFGENRASAHWKHFFSMVSSGLRRDAWSQRGFLETLQYSEDDEYTRWCRTAGYEVRFCPESVVMHSHNYTPAQAYKRSFGEALTLAQGWCGTKKDINTGRDLLLGWLKDIGGDFYYCGKTGCVSQWPAACAVRWQQRLGRLHGFRAGWQMHRVDCVL